MNKILFSLSEEAVKYVKRYPDKKRSKYIERLILQDKALEEQELIKDAIMLRDHPALQKEYGVLDAMRADLETDDLGWNN